MKTALFVFLICLFFSCKKKESIVVDLNAIIEIDVQNSELSFTLQKLSYTDSVKFVFGSLDQYNCNLYRINYALEQVGQSYKFVMGNVFYAPGMCVFGNFPATAIHQFSDLKNGTYQLKITKAGQLYSGSLVVTSNQYQFNWNYDNVLKINPKTINK